MKEYRIKPDGAVYQLMENADDLGIVRYSVLRNILIEESSGMKFPDLMEWFKSRQVFYSQADLYALMNSEINMAKQVDFNLDNNFNDTSHRIFALMVLEPGEDATAFDATKADEKLNRMAAEGLTQGEVFSVTENFILASPKLCNSFFLMSLTAMQKTLKSSKPMLQSLSDQLEVEALMNDFEPKEPSDT